MPTVISVAGSLTTIPAPFKPTIAINNPIPAEMAYFRLAGILFTKVSLNLNSDKIINTIPSINIAVSAIYQGSVIPLCASIGQTVYAKYAFSPIPDASAIG